MADKWQTVADAATQSGYSREHIRRLAREKTIPSKKVGTTVLVDGPALLRHKRDIEQSREATRTKN